MRYLLVGKIILHSEPSIRTAYNWLRSPRLKHFFKLRAKEPIFGPLERNTRILNFRKVNLETQRYLSRNRLLCVHFPIMGNIIYKTQLGFGEKLII